MSIFGLLSLISFDIAWIASYPAVFFIGILSALLYARKKVKEARCPHCKGSLESL